MIVMPLRHRLDAAGRERFPGNRPAKALLSGNRAASFSSGAAAAP